MVIFCSIFKIVILFNLDIVTQGRILTVEEDAWKNFAKHSSLASSQISDDFAKSLAIVLTGLLPLLSWSNTLHHDDSYKSVASALRHCDLQHLPSFSSFWPWSQTLTVAESVSICPSRYVTAMNSNSSCADFGLLKNGLRNEFAEVADFACLNCDPHRISWSREVFLRMANTNASRISKARWFVCFDFPDSH